MNFILRHTSHKLLILVSACAFLLPMMVSAETVVRTSDVISIASEQIIEQDFYSSAGTISMSGLIKGDMYAVAGTLTHNGVVEADLAVLAGTVQLHGKVADDVRILGGEVTIGGEIAGDVFVIGGTLKVLSTAKIGGDVFFFGESAEVEGEILGSVMGTYTSLRLNGLVAKDVDVKANKLVLGDRAKIEGGVRYVSTTELVRSQNAVITGEITKNTMTDAPDTTWRNLAISFLITLFGSMSFYLIFRSRLLTFITRDCAPLPMRGLIGLVLMIALPFVALLLMLTVLGFWLGLLALSSWLLLIVLAYLLVPIALGSWLWLIITQKTAVNTLTVLLGTLIFFALVQVPYIGLAAAIIVGCIMCGGFIMAVYRFIR